MIDEPPIVRTRHELKRRKLSVRQVEHIPAGMIRVVLGGDDLAGFTSLGFDDHVKVFFPGGLFGPVARDFTPRRFDRGCNQLWIDFFLHEAGPAAAWAAQAAIGQTLEVGGPKGSAVLELDGIDSTVLIGDETALPAIGRRLEELPSHIQALVVVESDDSADRPSLTSAAALQVVWVSREQDQVAERPEEQLIAALRQLDFPAGRCFAWVAHESGVARSIRAYLRDERGLDKKWIKAAGYWRRGATGSHDNITD